MKKNKDRKRELSRRDFLKVSTAASVTTLALGPRQIFAAGADPIRVGLIGCGGRGRYDINNCLTSSDGVELVAMGDLFQDQLDGTLMFLNEKLPDKVKVTPENCFVGFDAYKKVLACDPDLVILTTPPYFRPEHLRAAVEAGKHIFIEKPVAVDPVGVRSVIASSELAAQKNLTLGAGTQMRYIAHLIEGIERIHNGDLGDILSGQCFRLGGGMLDWYQDTIVRRRNWSDMEWQCRRWLFVNWLGGDFIVEMHVHNLDIINWALNSVPVKCMALGGRQVRTDSAYGNIFDNITAEYVYPNDVRIHYMGCQINGVSVKHYQKLVGALGSAYLDFGLVKIEGQNPYLTPEDSPDPCKIQHAELIKSIREGLPINEGRQIAESTLTAIMGRMSAYTGKELSWDWLMNSSKLDLSPPQLDFTDLPLAPVAAPGRTKLI